MSRSAESWHQLVSGERRGLRAYLARAGLWWLRWPYAVGVWFRNLQFRRGWRRVERVGVPVVSIGNLTTGGTGKTPCVEYVARFFREQAIQVAILSRGYGASGGRNDEAMLLEENLPDVPHLQDPDRVSLAQTAIEELESEVLILDDGFQHRRLARDLDIVLIDATNPWGYGYLLPRGAMREHRGCLRRANMVLVTRADQVEPGRLAEIRHEIQRVAPEMPLSVCRHAPVEAVNGSGKSCSLSSLKGQKVAAFCGIGNPTAFRRTVDGLGMELIAFRSYPDHHPYTRSDVDDLIRWGETLPEGTMIVTTQKDMVKLRLDTLGERPLWAIRIGIAFMEGEARFQEELRRVIESVSGSTQPVLDGG